MNEHIIDQVYDRLQETKTKYAADVEFYANAKAKREAAEARYVSEGKVPGKNKEQRAANLAKLVNHEQQTEKEAGLIMQQSKLELELAQIKVDRVRLLIRLLELEHRGK